MKHVKEVIDAIIMLKTFLRKTWYKLRCLDKYKQMEYVSWVKQLIHWYVASIHTQVFSAQKNQIGFPAKLFMKRHIEIWLKILINYLS